MTLLQCNKLPGHLTVLELPRSIQHIPQDCNAAAEAQALWFRTHPRQKVRQLHACRRSIHGYRYQDEFLYECFAARHANESSSFWQKCRLAPASKGCMAETTARPARRAIVRQQRSTSSPTPAAPRKAPAPSKPHAHPHPMGAPDSSGARRRRAKRASAREPDGNDAPDESGASRSNRACRLHEGLETCLRQVGAARAPRFRSKTDTTSLPELGSLGVYVGPTPQQVRARAQSRSTLSISSRSSLDASHQRGTGALPGPSTGA